MKRPIPFGKYYLLERINVGGMAEVFRAKAFGVEGFERLVAVKRILPNIAEDKEFIRMFIDEAKIAVQLNHANIAQVFDLGTVDGHYYIALEHVHGRDLRAIFDRCRQKGEPMPIAQACFIGMKLCEGLDYAHNKRDQAGRELHLVHRDVSPQNVLVSFEGEVKVIDFGIAKAAGKGSKTQAGILKGKFGYMSPEQVRGLPIDRRSDIFSCGIVLYELLTGERLFVGESDFSTLEKVRNVEILPPSTYNRKIPDELERIVLKALAKDDEDRYQNAIDLHDELQAFVYTAGEFYSRKDLAAWMKVVFAREIEEETAKLESYRQVSAPPSPTPAPPPRTKPPSAPPPGRRSSSGEMPTEDQLPRGTRPPQLQAAGQGGLEWDDDELETSIYPDREESPPRRSPSIGPAAALAAHAAEPDSGPLASTSRNWPPPSADAASASGRLGSLADGSGSSSAFSEDATVHDPRAMGTADPSAVLELATLGEQQRRYEAQLAASNYALPRSGFARHLTLPRIAVAAALLGAIIVLLVVVARGGGKPAEADPGALQTQASAQPAAEMPPALPPDPNSGFDLIVEPPGVKVTLDGRPIGKAPLQIRNLTDGEHVVDVEAPAGFAPAHETVRVTRGQAGRVALKLESLDVTGVFTSEPPGAAVTLVVDGQRQELGASPVQAKLDPRRRYEVSFQKDGYAAASRAVTMTGGQEVPVSVVLERLPARAPTAPVHSPARELDKVADVVERTPREPADAAPAPEREPARDKAPERTAAADKPEKPEKPEKDEEVVGEEAGEGTLALGAKPPCRIFIDGRDTGERTPQAAIKLKAGKHRITLVNNEFGIKESFVVRIKAGETVKSIKDLTSRIPSP